MLNAPLLRNIWEGILPALEERYQLEGDFPVGGLEYSTARERVPRLVRAIEEGAERIQSIVSGLKDFARQGAADFRDDVDVNEAVRAGVLLTGNRIGRSTRRFYLDLAPALPPMRGNAQRIEQVVINLLINACDALTDSDQAITVQTRYRAAQDAVYVVVGDEGPGMPPEVLRRAKDPFFTTKRERGGTGLGLAISDGIVRDHGGAMRVETEPGHGTTVTVELPRESGDVEGGF
jgi:C4-dicarboxylate-specific signal transduction histidine kinase